MNFALAFFWVRVFTPLQVHPERHNRSASRHALVACFLSALLLLSSFMAVSPALHKLLHHDANQASHQCVATLLQKHQVSASATSVVVPQLSSAVIGFVQVRNDLAPSSCAYLLPHTRGPPAFPTPITVIG
ncbi:MAG: hypothetical protein ACXWBP_10485 [Limisphaerales bacterium]